MDCLLIHAPRMRPAFNQVMVMSAGLFSLADVLDRHGVGVRICHLGLRPHLEQLLLEHRPRIVGLSLHWFYQTHDALQAARLIRKTLPAAKIVVGGFTASCFPHQLARRPEVDFVIRGDGEGALLALCNALAGKGGAARLREVPNLVFSTKCGRVAENPVVCLDTSQLVAGASLFRPDLLLDPDRYFSDDILYKDFDDRVEVNRRHLYSNALFYTPGRGCGFRCTFCGGSRDVHERLFSRKRPRFFSTKKILSDLKEATSRGIGTLRLSFDPDPFRRRYIDLFEAMKKEGLGELRLVFDCWTLPGAELMKKVSECFAPDSLLVLSPDSGSERIRNETKPHPAHAFSNDELMGCLETMRDAGVDAHLFFGAGLPFETSAHLQATQDIALEAHRLGFGCSVLPIDADPGSSVFCRPKKHGMSLVAETLEDYERLSRSDGPWIGARSSSLTGAAVDGFVTETVRKLNARRG
jgi:radical SAM superfamily enzyme YgiQ (UPF0313 family)